METCFYLAVKIAASAYILYKVWLLLFRDKLFGLWDRILTPPAGKGTRPAEMRPARPVLGATGRVILEDPRKAKPDPVSTTGLEQTGFIGMEEPVSADDVEAPEPPYVPSEDELDIPPPDDNAMSSGVSFEDLGNVVDVLKNGSRDEVRLVKAAKTAYDIQDTEIMETLVREVCRADEIGSLIKSYLDADGLPLKKRNPVAGFRIEDYV
jgi:hypothetical protein